MVLLFGDHAGWDPSMGWSTGPPTFARQHVSGPWTRPDRLVVQKRVGLPRTVRSNTIFPPQGENAGCSASPASLAVMLIGFGRPPPGGYRSITKRSPGPPLLGLPTYTMCGPPSGEKAGSRSLRRSFGVRSERPLPSAFMNQIELFDDEDGQPAREARHPSRPLAGDPARDGVPEQRAIHAHATDVPAASGSSREMVPLAEKWPGRPSGTRPTPRRCGSCRTRPPSVAPVSPRHW